MGSGHGERPACREQRVRHRRLRPHRLVSRDGQARLGSRHPASRAEARGIEAAAQQAGRRPQSLMIEQGAFELKRWRLNASSLGQHGPALEQYEPGGGFEEVAAQLDIGFARLLNTGMACEYPNWEACAGIR